MIQKMITDADFDTKPWEDIIYCPNCLDAKNNYGHLKVAVDEHGYELVAKDCDCTITDEQLQTMTDNFLADERNRGYDDWESDYYD